MSDPQPIPFGDLQESGYDPLSGAGASSMNVVLDAKGTMRRRPGITATADDLPDSSALDAVVGGDPIIGLHQVAGGDQYGMFGTRIFRFSAGGAAELAAVPLSYVTADARPIFAETEMLLVLAQQTDLRKVTILDAVPALSLVADSPPIASHVIANSSRLLANDRVIDRTKVRYSDVAIGTTSYAGHEVWTPGSNTAGFFTAEARPDAVVAVGENTNEVWVWGTETTQLYGSDPSLVFGPVRAMETGCSAPYSIVKYDSDFLWLDHHRRFVRSNGQEVAPISDALAPVFEQMTAVSDCFGYRVQVGVTDALVWTFPSDGRTFAYQPGVGWGQWQGWNDSTANWTQFSVTAHHQRISNTQDLVGTSAGRLGVLSHSASDDLGTRINAYVETGFLDRGTGARKRHRFTRLILRRGQTSGSSAPKGRLWWRDKPGSWEGGLVVNLGATGDYEAVITFRNLGVYRTRQWRFQFDAGDELVLVRAEEEFDVTGG